MAAQCCTAMFRTPPQHRVALALRAYRRPLAVRLHALKVCQQYAAGDDLQEGFRNYCSSRPMLHELTCTPNQALHEATIETTGGFCMQGLHAAAWADWQVHSCGVCQQCSMVLSLLQLLASTHGPGSCKSSQQTQTPLQWHPPVPREPLGAAAPMRATYTDAAADPKCLHGQHVHGRQHQAASAGPPACRVRQHGAHANDSGFSSLLDKPVAKMEA